MSDLTRAKSLFRLGAVSPHSCRGAITVSSLPPPIGNASPMSSALLATKWPKNAPDFNDTIPYAFATVFVQTEKAGVTVPLHSHPNGQFSIPLSGGRCGVELEDHRWVLPRYAAAWLPPGTLHNGIQDAGAELMTLYVAPQVACTFPTRPMRILLNPMTFEMIRHFTKVYGSSDRSLHAKRIAKLFIEELRHAPELPKGFAPLSNHPALQRITEDLLRPELRNLSNEAWASRLNMTARTLSRLVSRETGLSFAKWRLHMVLLASLNDLNDGRSIESTSYKAGFETPSAYIEAFKKIFGRTPGNFRKNLLLLGEDPDWTIDYEHKDTVDTRIRLEDRGNPDCPK